MTELLTAAQMRAIEHAAIESGEVTGLELMERAGQGVVDAIFEEWPDLAQTSHRAVVLCGPGNNGGDGFVVARLLKEWGWEVEVFLYGDPEKLPPDARVNYERWGELGEVKPIPEGSWTPNCDLHVDALFGTGLARAVPEPIAYSLSYLHHPHGHFRAVAVDIPSGLCSDSAETFQGVSGKADLTVTFHRPKIAHFLQNGATRCGAVVTASIGLQERASGQRVIKLLEDPPQPEGKGRSGAESAGQRVTLIEPNPDHFRKAASPHKYTHGHALILAGRPGKTGAARLAARGALRIGAGLVTIACPSAALPEVAAQTTALMCRPLDGAAALAEALIDDRLNALCLGPGMGIGADTRQLVLTALAASNPAPPPEPGPGGQKVRGPGSSPGRAVVLDADALTSFTDDPDALFNALNKNTVLTPHGGEFRRLFPDIADRLAAPATKGPAYSKVDATRDAAARAGCTVLFKGPDTVIADQTGRCAINSSAYDRAAPWLATAGSGDVLAGFITGLLARGFSPMQAAEAAAWLHTECALSFGPGLIAEDLPEELPKVFRALNL